jgi:uncharacterized protein YlaI
LDCDESNLIFSRRISVDITTQLAMETPPILSPLFCDDEVILNSTDPSDAEAPLTPNVPSAEWPIEDAPIIGDFDAQLFHHHFFDIHHTPSPPPSPTPVPEPHSQTEEDDEPEEAENDTNPPSPNPYADQYKVKLNSTARPQNHNIRRVKCRICHRRVADGREVKLHHIRYHMRIHEYYCLEHQHKLATRAVMLRHIQRRHSGQRHPRINQVYDPKIEDIRVIRPRYHHFFEDEITWKAPAKIKRKCV